MKSLPQVLLVDDNPAERSLVRMSLPEVYVPEWPEDPGEYKAALLDLAGEYFCRVAVTAEDRERNGPTWFKKLSPPIHGEALEQIRHGAPVPGDCREVVGGAAAGDPFMVATDIGGVGGDVGSAGRLPEGDLAPPILRAAVAE